MRARLRWPRLGVLVDSLMPFAALLAALLVGAVMLLALGANPVEAYGALLEGAFGSPNALADTAVKATPLLFVGLGICIAFRGGVINVGGEGQMLAGALTGGIVALSFPNASGWLIIPLALLAGFLGGMVWGGIPGVLKAHFNVNEILSTIMMNQIATQGMNFLLNGLLLDPDQFQSASKIPQSARIAAAFDLPRLVPTRLHAGALVAIILAIVVYIFLWRTTTGYRIRAVGQNPEAARYAGISVRRTTVLCLALSGAFAGLAGAVTVLGVTYRLTTGGAAAGFTGSAGFNGIVAALFGQLHPIGTIPAAFFFGALLVGANKLQRVVQVPAALITALNGLIVIFVVSSELWRRQRAQRREMTQSSLPASASAPQGEGEQDDKQQEARHDR